MCSSVLVITCIQSWIERTSTIVCIIFWVQPHPVNLLPSNFCSKVLCVSYDYLTFYWIIGGMENNEIDAKMKDLALNIEKFSGEAPPPPPPFFAPFGRRPTLPVSTPLSHNPAYAPGITGRAGLGLSRTAISHIRYTPNNSTFVLRLGGPEVWHHVLLHGRMRNCRIAEEGTEHMDILWKQRNGSNWESNDRKPEAPLGTVRLIRLGRSSREKTLAPTDALFFWGKKPGVKPQGANLTSTKNREGGWVPQDDWPVVLMCSGLENMWRCTSKKKLIRWLLTCEKKHEKKPLWRENTSRLCRCALPSRRYHFLSSRIYFHDMLRSECTFPLVWNELSYGTGVHAPEKKNLGSTHLGEQGWPDPTDPNVTFVRIWRVKSFLYTLWYAHVDGAPEIELVDFLYDVHPFGCLVSAIFNMATVKD